MSYLKAVRSFLREFREINEQARTGRRPMKARIAAESRLQAK